MILKLLSTTSEDGMHRRTTYDELQDLPDNKEQWSTYPDRRAAQLGNTHELSNLIVGECMGSVDWEKQLITIAAHQNSDC